MLSDLLQGTAQELYPYPAAIPVAGATGKNPKTVVSFKYFASYMSELVGSFVFVFLFMICTDKKT